MKRSGLRGTDGITLIETVVYAGAVAVMGLLVARMLTQTPHLTTSLNTMFFQQTSYNQTNLPVADMLSAIGVSIKWDKIDPSQSNYDQVNGPLFIPWFQIHDPAINAPSYVCYRYDAPTQTIRRTYIPGNVTPNPHVNNSCIPNSLDHPVTTTVAQHVVAPTPQNPLFAKDLAASNMVIFTFKVQQQGYGADPKHPLTVQRRVYVPT